jgi:glycosyltransferase 2 family protein
MKKMAQLAVGCSVSAVMMYMAFKDLDIGQLQNNISQLALWPILPFVALFIVHYYLRSIRWRLLLPSPQGNAVELRKLFDSMMVGNLATFLLPFRLGEFIRPLMLTRLSEYSFASSFISVVIERFFDLSAVLISFAIVIPLLPELPPWATVAAYSLGALALCLLLFLVFGCLFPKFIRSMVEIFVQPLPDKVGAFVSRFLGDLLTGAAVIATPSRLIAIVGLTVLIWISSFLQFYDLLFMFPQEQRSFLLGVTLCVFVSLAVALPSAPGFVGVFQMGCVAAAALFAYSVSAAQLYSILVHLLTFVLVIGMGFWVLAVHDLNLFELKKAAEKDS